MKYETKCRLYLLLIVSLVFFIVGYANAAKNIQAEFTYDQPAESFNLYMNGTIICSDVTVGTMNCNNLEIGYGMHQFTMTAISDGLESLHSPPYMWSYSPVQSKGPTIINFNITVEDGTVTPLSSIKVE